MTSATETINEAVGEIVTRDVALRVECPNCGAETDYAISDFDYTDLWYGQESVICPTCKNMLRIYHVYRG